MSIPSLFVCPKVCPAPVVQLLQVQRILSSELAVQTDDWGLHGSEWSPTAELLSMMSTMPWALTARSPTGSI